MTDLVLYHYPLSPFSEKIRLMLGHTGLPWRSVAVDAMPPRPALAILAGGYRRIPVAQLGADVYCDTHTIAALIAKLAGRPGLDPDHATADAQTLIRHAESAVFFAIIASAGSGLLRRVFSELGPRGTLRFVRDRIDIARRAQVPKVSGRSARLVLGEHLDDLERRLQAADYLSGDEPGCADFSAALGLWFGKRIGARLPAMGPRVSAWRERMQAPGHGPSTPLQAEAALDQARAAQPAELGELAVAAPAEVSIAPRDYARDPVRGLLVGESPGAWILRHEHERIGCVHLHLPKLGYSLRTA